jgi:flagellar biosynthetic protein FliR
VLGLAFHFAMSVIGVLGFIVSSQMGLSMAVMNDPLNGQSSDVTSALLSTWPSSCSLPSTATW